MARRRGLGGTAFTKKDLKAQAKACGSHYFESGTMRFFNSRLLSVHPVPGRNVTYFVEGKGGGSWPTIKRHYTVGVFKGCRIESLGQGVGRGAQKGTYTSSRKAKQVAEAIAKKASGGGATLKRKRRRR
jgi:hypothetical protein